MMNHDTSNVSSYCRVSVVSVMNFNSVGYLLLENGVYEMVHCTVL